MKELTLENLVLNAKKYGKEYLTDTTGLLAFSMPLAAAIETYGYGLDVTESIAVRTNITLTAYLGAAIFYSKSRDLAHNLFDITEESSTKKRAMVDMGHSVAFNVPFTAIMYSWGGAEFHEVVLGAMFATPLAMVFAPVNAYALDVSRHLTGVNESTIVPMFLQEASDSAKKKMFAGVGIGSLLSTGLVYKVDEYIGGHLDNVRELIVNYGSHLF